MGGDVLHIPPCWWHCIEMLPSPPAGESVSLSFWFPPCEWCAGDTDSDQVDLDVSRPLFGHQRTMILRYAEITAAQTAHPSKVLDVLRLCSSRQPPSSSDDFRSLVSAASAVAGL